jgi:hypothetical protein
MTKGIIQPRSIDGNNVSNLSVAAIDTVVAMTRVYSVSMANLSSLDLCG